MRERTDARTLGAPGAVFQPQPDALRRLRERGIPPKNKFHFAIISARRATEARRGTTWFRELVGWGVSDD